MRRVALVAVDMLVAAMWLLLAWESWRGIVPRSASIVAFLLLAFLMMVEALKDWWKQC